MTDNFSDRKQILFLSLVQSLASNAWIHLGKIKNPISGTMTVNLTEASLTIDMLEMLHEKTKGNLSDDERRLLERSVGDLKMNFVEAKLHAPQSPAEPAANKESAPTDQSTPPSN
ncbi:MAG: DUF1844 domain-containing protein [Candidatus Neomarinimicrobiota bacterium]